MSKSDRIDVYLVAGGKYHNIDHARLELLKLLAEQPRIKVRVGEDYSDIDAICAADFIITYTCDVIPGETQTRRLQDYINAGGKWFALHGTNSILEFLAPDADGNPQVDCPEHNTPFMEILGSQFIAHPPIHEYEVLVTEPDHPLVTGIPTFTVDDELYLSKFHGDYRTLLHTHWSDTVANFVRTDWVKQTDVQPVLYLHPYGEGTVLYLTLGHCRGKYDMQPLIEEYPAAEEGAWKTPEFHELLRRGIRWAMAPGH
ncbi:MAG: ThuA domain-containing protein [Pseudomonadales bacterium]|nr:ThuA domain-containing protein [Halioglobus sp.]MCP5123696.1 ThuA domain-containing protein [Pseudomonadales bacterium]MCP5192017.1 ThuA domain-containing protein [Pseudomonadales bacterium]